MIRRPLYVQRKLLNADDVMRHYFGRNFNKEAANDLHLTVMYSKQPVAWDWIVPDVDSVVATPGAEHLVFSHRDSPTGKAVVLPVVSERLHDRFRYYMGRGCSCSFPDYQPHITIGEAFAPAKLEYAKPYTGPLILGPELMEDIQEG